MIICSACQKEISHEAKTCPHCGQPSPDKPVGYVSPKSRAAAALLCLFLGCFGIHRFYVGKIGTGILQLITLGLFGIWAFIDLVFILVGSFRDKENRPLTVW
jgi:hypothetical protein